MQPLSLFYKKMDKCISLLEELNSQMRDLRRQYAKAKKAESMARNTEPAERILAVEAEPQSIAATAADSYREENTATEKYDRYARKQGFNIDKLGRVYTEEEIRKLIAD